MSQSKIIEPQQKAGGGHHTGSPEKRPVLHFFRVIELRELRRCGAESKVVPDYVEQVGGVTPFRQHGPEKRSIAAMHGEVNEVVDGRGDQQNRSRAMDTSAKCTALFP